jgi:uncharacterized protein
MEEKNIIDLCHSLCDTNNVKLIFCCESGSRSWGYASEDSDYDVRGIYVRDEIDYIYTLFGKGNDNGVIEKIEGNYDIVLWDVRKVIEVYFQNINQMPVWWLTSDIVYFENELGSTLKRFIVSKNDNVIDRIVAGYFGIIMQKLKRIQMTPKRKVKHYIYIWRSILCANYAIRLQTSPPHNIHVLLSESKDEYIKGKIDTLLKIKREGSELIEMSCDDNSSLNGYIENIKAFVVTTRKSKFTFGEDWENLVKTVISYTEQLNN